MLGDMEKRTEWDSNIVKVNMLDKPTNNLAIYQYIFRNPILFYKDREFLDKCLVFQDEVDKCFYIYMSSVPNSICPVDLSCIRGKDLISFYQVKAGNEGRTVITLGYQLDFKFSSRDKMLYIEYGRQLEYLMIELLAQLNKTEGIDPF